MVFSSLIFIFVFLPVSLLLYYLVPYRFKNSVLLVLSMCFYAWGEPKYIILMLAEIIFDFTAGRAIVRCKNPTLKKAVLSAAILLVLLLLGYFKYAGLLFTTVSSFTGLRFSLPEIALPIGISFYTFESISYLVDLYRGEAEEQSSLIDFGTYLSLFPHLIAGPIVKYSEIAQQLKNRVVSFENLTYGCKRFCTGLFKKVLIADQLAFVVSRIQYYNELSVLGVWIEAIAFTFQIYFDFSGYSDMAIGLGRMFGFYLPENFNLPYLSKSAAEFWRRWHMTLGGWFRQYLYYPLGGNRCSRLKNIRNLAIVWTLTGLWHGASWNFAFWGAYWGVLIICEKLFLNRILEKIPPFFRWLYAFLAAVIGWVFFNNSDLGKAFQLIAAMFGHAPFTDRLSIYTALTSGLLIIIAAIGSSGLPGKISKKVTDKGLLGKLAWNLAYALLFVVTITFLVRNSYSPFLYFRF